MRIELREISNARGTQLVESLHEHPLFTLFHTADWLTFLEGHYGLQGLYLEVLHDGRPAGVMPAVRARKGPLRIVASPLTGTNTPYMGPLVDPKLLPEAAEAFRRYAREAGADYVELSLPVPLHDSGAVTSNFVCASTDTYVLAIRPTEDEMWKALPSKCRNMVRKAQKSGLAVVDGCRAELPLYHRMLSEVFARRGQVPGQSQAFFEQLWDTLEAKGRMRFVLGEHEGRVVAGAVFLWDDRTAYYISGASRPEGNRLAANNLLQWEFLRLAGALGLESYNLCGKGIASIDRFKKSFGPAEYSYAYLWRCLNWRARVGRAVYRAAVPLIRRARRLTQSAGVDR